MFAAPLFAFRFEADVWMRERAVFVAFCLISSAIHLLNDCLDVAADRGHPSKRHWPIAAGVVLMFGLVRVGCCLQLMRMPLLDLLCMVSGFLLQAIAVVVAAGFGFSPWFLLTVGLLAMFLAIEKRKAWERYSLPLPLRLEGLVATSGCIGYSLWAAGHALHGASTTWMLLTVPFVLAGIFCYQLLTDPVAAERRRLLAPERTSEKAEEILLGDRGTPFTPLARLLTVVVGLNPRADLLPEGGLHS